MSLKIEKALEMEQEQEKKEISASIEPDTQTAGTSSDTRSVLIMIAVLLGLFALALGGFKLYNHFNTAAVVVVDDLHQQNLEGKLDSDQGYVYNGYSFVKADGLWWTEVESKDRVIKIPLHYGPKDVEKISVKGKLSPNFNKGDKVYISIDPTVSYDKYYTLGLMELNTNILQGAQRQIEAVCSQENPICENRTIVNCDNQDIITQPVIQLVRSEQTGVQLSGSCIKISGKDEDLVKAVDKVLYGWYKVFG